MIIDGNATPEVLDSYCQSPAQKYLGIYSKCFVTWMNDAMGDEKICLDMLNIPLDSAAKFTHLIVAGGTLSLDTSFDYKVAIINEIDNKSILWRQVDSFGGNDVIASFGYTSAITTGDVSLQRVPVTIDLVITPDGTNVLTYPTLTGKIEGSLYENADGSIISGTVVGTLSDTSGKLNINLTYTLLYNRDTQVLTYGLTTAKLIPPEFVKDSMVVTESLKTFSVSDNIVTASINGVIATTSAKRYKRLKALMMLSSTQNLDKIEFYNNSVDAVNLNILLTNKG